MTFAVCKEDDVIDKSDAESYLSTSSLSDLDDHDDYEYEEGLCDMEVAKTLHDILVKMQKAGLPLPIAPATAFLLTEGQVRQTLKYLQSPSQ